MNNNNIHNLLSKDEWTKTLEIKDTLLMLECSARWCGPCMVIAPQIVHFSKTYPTVRFYKLDVDDVSDVAQDLGIRVMPTYFLFKDGEKVVEILGPNPSALEAAIKANLG